MAKKTTITKRWIINGLAVIVALLLVFGIVCVLAFRSYSYQNVQAVLYNRAGRMGNALSEYVKDDPTFDFQNGARTILAAFSEQDMMEMQILDGDGRAVMSSTGFKPAGDEMPDYERALESSDDIGVWQGRNENNENVMALTLVVRNSSSRSVSGAVRYVVSLAAVDGQVQLVGVLIVLIGLVILFLVLLSGSFFISSIVAPVAEIGGAARRIALGDYDYRLTKQRDDELGDLCDTINYMVTEIVAAEKMKNEFISTVSHELRTPLTAIKGWSETLRDTENDEETMKKGLAVIEGETERLSGIVEQLLDFSRLQSGHIPMKFAAVDLETELQEVVLLFAERARREQITLEFVEPPRLPIITADGARIRQVLVNVLDNALKYSNAGGRVRVEAADMNRAVQIVVSDSGVCIDKDDLPHIKDKFYKANKTRPGSGIGLALADEIIRQHGGHLDIDSEEGVGTTVTIVLPLDRPSEP